MKASTRYVIIGILGVIALVSTYVMIDSYFWGYLPTLLFASVWGIIILIWVPWRSRSNKKWLFLGMSTLAGLVLSLGFPPLPTAFLMFGGFVPLLFIEEKIRKEKHRKSAWVFFPYLLHAFMLWNILATAWVANAALLAGLAANVLNGLFMTIPFLVFHLTIKKMPKTGYISLIAYWLSFELLHFHWDLAWPWLTLGNSWASLPSAIQWYEYTGVTGGSLWILLGNVLLFMLAKNYFYTQKINKKYLLRLVALLLIPLAFSFYTYYNYDAKTGDTIEVVAVQPNYNPHLVTPTNSVVLEDVFRLASPLLDENVDWLVLPEALLERINLNQLEADPTLKQFQRKIKAYPKLQVITGLGGARRLLEEEADDEYTRKWINCQKGVCDTIRFEGHNAVVQLSADSVLGYYNKSRLTPGAEYMPFGQYLGFLGGMMESLGGSTKGFVKMKERVVFKNGKSNVAPIICYESVFGGFVNGFVRKDANVLFISTNDGWWDNTQGYRQHKMFASLRAIEQRRSVVRAALTGTSCFINQRGDIRQATAYEQATAIRGTLHLNETPTFYTYWGDLIARIGLFVAALMFLNLVSKFARRR